MTVQCYTILLLDITHSPVSVAVLGRQPDGMVETPAQDDITSPASASTPDVAHWASTLAPSHRHYTQSLFLTG